MRRISQLPAFSVAVLLGGILLTGTELANADTKAAEPKASQGHHPAPPLPGKPTAGEHAAAKGESKEGKAEGKEAAKGEEGKGKEEKGKEGEKEGELPKALQARIDKLNETRKERAEQMRHALEKKWGATLLMTPPVREALKVHAWRMARLERMSLLAEAADKANKDKLIKRIQKLKEKENARFEKHMAQLREHQAASPAGSAEPEKGGKAMGKQPGHSEKAEPAEKAKSNGKSEKAKGGAQ
ncbi:MAG TPA: hypothetical protein VGJ84_05470 [Polyangiaceae bacterium]